MQDFRHLKVWQKSHELTLAMYRLTSAFPREEVYGLSAQMRSSSSSIPTNLAEGCGRGTDAELARFAQISMGSASELEYQCLLARDLGYLDEATYSASVEPVIEVKRMLAPVIRSLRNTNDKGARAAAKGTDSLND